MFELDKGAAKSKISVKDYVKQKYNKIIQYPDLPCIDLGKGSYLPMELCRTELKNKKKLNEQETADMIKHTAVKAPDRSNYIQTWINTCNIDKDPVLREFDIKVDLRPVELSGRVLAAPDIQYGGKPTPFVTMSRNIGEKGSWDHRTAKFLNSITVKKWIVLNFSGRVRQDAAWSFAMALVKIGNIHGITLPDPADYAELRNPSTETTRRLFENMYTKHKGNFNFMRGKLMFI